MSDRSEGPYAGCDGLLVEVGEDMERSSRSEDFREGLVAFSEKGDARFGGR